MQTEEVRARAEMQAEEMRAADGEMDGTCQGGNCDGEQEGEYHGGCHR